MRWNWSSTRLRLLAFLLPVLAIETAAGLWFTRADAVASANAAYDRSLLGAIKSLDLNVSTASGGLSVELPYRLFEFFQLTATGNVYFRVATADGLVEIGHADLPPPPKPLRDNQPLFYDAEYFGEAVRVGAFMRPLEGDAPRQQLVIQVAESTTSRQQFTASFVQRAAVRDVLLLLVLGVSVFLGLAAALSPITRLAERIRARASDDLRPLPGDDVPSDIRPLVDAVNQQMQRIGQLVQERQGFIDDASHQLRTPLATLRAQLDYALREGDAGRQRAALQALSSGLAQATRATNQLLALARSDAALVQLQTLDLGALVREAAMALLPAARERGMDLGVEGAEPPTPAQGDVELLRQALLNLVHNAIEHGRAQGVVTLRVAADGLGYSLQVIDDGPGLPPELAGRAGQRFAKGRGSRGSGLGLAIARSVVERHGGALRVESGEAGAGTCATLWWPRP